MRQTWLLGALLLAGCSKPEHDSDLQNALSIELKDPSSSQFQNVTENPQLICGELNAKNSYGAYEGFKAFVFERASKTLWVADGDQANNHYKQFLDIMDKCENGSDLFMHQVERANKAFSSGSGSIDMNATDMNAVDMNATVDAADAALSAADQEIDDTSEAIENAQGEIRGSDGDDEPTYDVNNDAGE
jgi:hypothetical protein